MLSALQQAKKRIFAVPPTAAASSKSLNKSTASTGASAPASSSTAKPADPDALSQVAATAAAAASSGATARSAKAARIRNIQTSMNKERAVREAQEPFDFWTNVKRVNWTALTIFMVGWSVLGYYVVPTVKGWKDVWTPPTQAEKDAEFKKGKEKFLQDTYRLTQRHEARRARAERLDQLASQQQPESEPKSESRM